MSKLFCPKCSCQYDHQDDGKAHQFTCAKCGFTFTLEERKEREKGKFEQGWLLFRDSISLILKKPILALPIFCTWAILASITVYLKYSYKFPEGFIANCLLAFFVISCFSLSICLSNCFMLEFIERIESEKRVDIFHATFEAVFRDFIKVVPLAIAWAFIWFFIVLLRAIRRAFRQGPEDNDGIDDEASLEGAAHTLAGIDGSPFSWFELGLSLFEKLVRMTVFLSLPAIAWENKGPWSSLKKSFQIIKKHPLQFLTVYTLTELAAIAIAIPAVPIFFLAGIGVSFPDIVWVLVIVYIGFTWTLGIYLEQMSVSLLYLWNMQWERNGNHEELSDEPKPSLLKASSTISNTSQ